MALASDEAQGITGQCFFVYGGVISVLKPWDVGQILKKDDRWEAGELVAKLREIFPDGIAPEGMGRAMIARPLGRGDRACLRRSLSFELPVDQDKAAEFAVAVGDDNPVYFDPQAALEQGIPGVPGSPNVHGDAAVGGAT